MLDHHEHDHTQDNRGRQRRMWQNVVQDHAVNGDERGNPNGQDKNAQHGKAAPFQAV